MIFNEITHEFINQLIANDAMNSSKINDLEKMVEKHELVIKCIFRKNPGMEFGIEKTIKNKEKDDV